MSHLVMGVAELSVTAGASYLRLWKGHTRMMNIPGLALGALATVGLAACGGAGSNPTAAPDTTSPPVSASVTAAPAQTAEPAQAACGAAGQKAFPIHRNSGGSIGQRFCVTGKYTVDYSGDIVGCSVVLHGPDNYGGGAALNIFGAPGAMAPGAPLFGLEPGTYHFEQTGSQPNGVPCTAKFTVSLIPVNG